MYLFLFTVFPAVLALCAGRDYARCGGLSFLKKYLLAVVFGAVCGAVLCAVLEFFVFIPDYHGVSFFVCAVLDWLAFFVVPALFFTLFLLWSRDQAETKAASFLYFMFSFCSIYIPYLCFSGDGRNSFFMIFAVPVLIVFTLMALNREVVVLLSGASLVRVLLGIVLVLVESAVVPILLAAWHFDVFFALYLIGSAAWILFCGFRACFQKTSLALFR